MKIDPTFGRVLCVATVAAIMLPVGPIIFPLLSATLGHVPFAAVEATLSATLGFGIFSLLSG